MERVQEWSVVILMGQHAAKEGAKLQASTQQRGAPGKGWVGKDAVCWLLLKSLTPGKGQPIRHSCTGEAIPVTSLLSHPKQTAQVTQVVEWVMVVMVVVVWCCWETGERGGEVQLFNCMSLTVSAQCCTKSASCSLASPRQATHPYSGHSTLSAFGSRGHAVSSINYCNK